MGKNWIKVKGANIMFSVFGFLIDACRLYCEAFASQMQIEKVQYRLLTEHYVPHSYLYVIILLQVLAYTFLHFSSSSIWLESDGWCC